MSPLDMYKNVFTNIIYSFKLEVTQRSTGYRMDKLIVVHSYTVVIYIYGNENQQTKVTCNNVD